MKITIDTEILQRNNFTLGEFLVMLFGYCDVKYKGNFYKLVEKSIISKNLFDKDSMVLSNNTRDLIAKVLIESDAKVMGYELNFEELAKKLQDIYPKGNKPGTTYNWGDNTTVIAFKLRTLVAKYGFIFTEEEAIKATKEYVESFEDDNKNMRLLKYFILRTSKDDSIDSMFMTIIENNR
jgi:hypothetical protein